ncbi:MAG: aminoacyl-tRNA hydrolase [Bacteroidetes bacterium]|nr:aminoacyl-tRNA hydrolase [Bacteroidota bacterium]
MASPKRLIIGLGNPGDEYDQTRHNVGFMVVDALAEKTGTVLKTKGQAILGAGRWRSRPLVLAKPTTYMNRSGLAVQALMQNLKMEPVDLLVVVDDIHLPTGKIRLRDKGGTGGHNGLEDIIDWLGTDCFPRVRVGIGNEFTRGNQSDYVLSPFSEDEQTAIDTAIEHARDAALTFVTDGMITAMNRFSR